MADTFSNSSGTMTLPKLNSLLRPYEYSISLVTIRPIEKAKKSCAEKLFNEMSTSKVKYHDVDSYQSLLDIMNSV